MRFYLLEPILDVVEGTLLAAIVDEQNAHGSLIIGLCDRSEALLPSRVPHLQLHALVVHLDGLYPEIDAYRGHVRGGKLVVGEAQEQASLADARVADDDELCLLYTSPSPRDRG